MSVRPALYDARAGSVSSNISMASCSLSTVSGITTVLHSGTHLSLIFESRSGKNVLPALVTLSVLLMGVITVLTKMAPTLSQSACFAGVTAI